MLEDDIGAGHSVALCHHRRRFGDLGVQLLLKDVLLCFEGRRFANLGIQFVLDGRYMVIGYIHFLPKIDDVTV